jgi:hypothetical protein
VEGSDANGGRLPSNMESLIDAVGIWHPEEDGESFPSEEIAQVYGRRDDGVCMLCVAPLGTATLAVVDTRGVQLLFCGPECMQDMTIMQWLMEEYDDIVDTVKFRHGKGDVPPDEPAGDPDDPREE